MRASNPLDIRTAITQVQTALVDVLSLAYQARYPEVADLPALQSLDWNRIERALIFVRSEGVVYRWSNASTLAPVLPYVVAPSSNPPNGRWLRQSSSVTLGPAWFRPLHRVRTGYARAVQIYQGEDGEALERVYGQRPAILVEWLSDELAVKSYQHGAIYDYAWKFAIHCLSKNLRTGPDAVIGSDVAADAGTVPDPGLYQMIGDVRYLLGGCTLGLEPGIKFCDVSGAARIVETDLAQRLFRAELDVVVKGSVHVVDEDLIQNPQVWVERRDAGTPAGESFDASNYVALGYKFAPQPGLTAIPSAGVAYVGGQLVSSSPGAHTFEDDADTYRDLYPDGRLAYSAVSIGADAPPVTPGTLRVGLTRTEGGAITGDSYLCSYSVPSGADPGDPFRAA